MTEQALQAEVLRLRQQVAKLRAIARILFACLRALDIDLSRRRVPDGPSKARLLRAVEAGRDVLPLRKALAMIGLSASRLHAWKRAERGCDLDDHSSCPNTSPHQVTSAEVDVIKEMVTSPDYRHVPTGTLAVLAQRIGRVFASATTWRRLVRERGSRRPRLRVHPAKPKIGIRAEKPNEIWHIDTTIIRLVDGSKAYLHAVIDNFSRRILSWRVAANFDTGNTVAVLLDASQTTRSSKGDPPMVLADGGVENVNRKIDELIESGLLHRVLAMTELRFSNSMIEAWWRVLKHQWLFLNTLDNVETVEKLVKFYVKEHNQRLPHSAFRGQTPDEMYFGKGDGIPDDLESARKAARTERLAVNRSLSCAVCESSPESDAA
ncbi:MAG: DDE-type integrase/transposase/recombinase [Myxococcales bacterium]|nr:DDE-type integrase/transposase/recombinase [Myxococcales bacterium]